MNTPSLPKIAFLLVLATLFAVNKSHAQWSVGATYENKNEMPRSGFGLQIERDLRLPLPMLFIRTRAHYSYFNENNSVTLDGITLDRKVSSYDFGAGALAGLNIGLFSPYAGMGIGLENYSMTGEGNDDVIPTGNEVYYQAMLGLGLNALPLIKPFVELRYTGFSHTREITDSEQRIVLGVALRF